MTPMFPGWHLPTLRKKPRTDAQKIIEVKERIHNMSFSRLGKLLSRYIPESCFMINRRTVFSRRRVFSIENTFWGFFQQILSTDGGCQEIVNQYRVLAELRNLKSISPSTSAYCQARQKLSRDMLEGIFAQTQNHIPSKDSYLPLLGRRVVVADGTGISMSDTSVNQEK